MAGNGLLSIFFGFPDIILFNINGGRSIIKISVLDLTPRGSYNHKSGTYIIVNKYQGVFSTSITVSRIKVIEGRYVVLHGPLIRMIAECLVSKPMRIVSGQQVGNRE